MIHKTRSSSSKTECGAQGVQVSPVWECVTCPDCLTKAPATALSEVQLRERLVQYADQAIAHVEAELAELHARRAQLVLELADARLTEALKAVQS
jgi:hypothetical protein